MTADRKPVGRRELFFVGAAAATAVTTRAGAAKAALPEEGQAIVSVVDDFGADPSGSADSSAAFQCAVNTLAGTGTTLWVPDGTYVINSAPTIPAGSSLRVSVGVTFMGPGAAELSSLGTDSVFQVAIGGAQTAVYQPLQAYVTGYAAQGPGPFSVSYATALFNSTYDHVQSVGYNTEGAVSSEPQIRWSIESCFEASPGNYTCEMHSQIYEPGTTPGFIRPFTVSYQRGNSPSPVNPKGQLAISMFWNDAGTPGKGYLQWVEYSTMAQIIKWTTNQAFIVPNTYVFNFGGKLEFLGQSPPGTTPGTGFMAIGDSSAHSYFQLDSYNQLFQLWLDNARQAYFYAGSLNLGAKLKGDGGPLLFGASGAIDLSHGGTTTLTPLQASNPVVQLKDAGLTGDAAVVLPTTAGPAEWTVDLSAVAFASQSVTFAMGTSSKTVTVDSQVVLRIYSDGVGKLYALTYS